MERGVENDEKETKDSVAEGYQYPLSLPGVVGRLTHYFAPGLVPLAFLQPVERGGSQGTRRHARILLGSASYVLASQGGCTLVPARDSVPSGRNSSGGLAGINYGVLLHNRLEPRSYNASPNGGNHPHYSWWLLGSYSH